MIPESFDLPATPWGNPPGIMPLAGEPVVISPPPNADPAIRRSWQRSALRLAPTTLPRLRMLQGEALHRMVQAQSDLIDVARPYLEDIHQFVEGTGVAMLLTDRAACILDLFGDAKLLDLLAGLDLTQGAYWDEGHAGTNAVALALAEAMPIQVVGEEHYLETYHGLACSAAPIHDVKGRIAGALAMIGGFNSNHPHTLATVMAAARAITNQLQTDLFLQEANYRLAELNSVFSAITEGVIAWDQNEQLIHINDQAGAILGLSPRSAIGRPLYRAVQLPAPLADAIRNGEALQDVEATFTVEGRSVDCIVSLQPIFEGLRGPAGYIATLRLAGQVRQLVNRIVGAQATYTLEDFLGQSSAMWQVRRQVRVAARGTAPVMLQGEGGVGKDLLAQAIHNESPRADGPFISVNCQAIPHELMANALLGNESGGPSLGTPSPGRPSKFELAHGGTLFLDDIECLSLEMQALLLAVIRQGCVSRNGGSRRIPIDIRIIASTSVDLEQLVAEGSFHPDLYYRFGVFTITVPSLRDRPEDIPILAESFLERLSRQLGKRIRLAPETTEKLLHYPWPGNNRELMTILERASSLCTDGIIRPQDLPLSIRRGWVLTPNASSPQPVLSLQEAERDAIIRAGWAYKGRVNHMADHLGISRTTLWRKMREFQIVPADFKESVAG